MRASTLGVSRSDFGRCPGWRPKLLPLLVLWGNPVLRSSELTQLLVASYRDMIIKEERGEDGSNMLPNGV